MLIFALILAVILFTFANAASRSSRRQVIAVPMLGLLAGLLCGGFPPVLLFAVLLIVLGAVWKTAGWGPTTYAGLSLTAFALAFGITGASAVQSQIEYAKLRDRFPYESMEGRAPTPSGDTSNVDAKRLDTLESDVAEGGSFRGFMLARLHEQAVREFINSPGFGVMRRITPSERAITSGLRTEPAPLQPLNPDYSVIPKPFLPPQEDLDRLHRNSVVDFVHPVGFGNVKDRQHVAGFQSHRFSSVPETNEVAASRLELVSLLMHKEPGVYLSDRLPQMDALKGVPTRPLDAFESEGLAALKKGEDLFVREDRMLGAIRSVKQCIACHGGERGQLLGAFTYTLRPAAK